MKFAWIPPGTFLMGSPPNEAERGDDETQHRVTLTKGFWLGVHQVTQAQWQAVMGGNPSHFKGDNLPVEQISWDDCRGLLRGAGQEGRQDVPPADGGGMGVRLPGRHDDAVPLRRHDLHRQANYDGNYTYGNGKKGLYRRKTTPVGSFPANAWGLYDMHGNVWEWCADWYGGPHPAFDLTDPQGGNSGDARVLRGGSWHFHPRYCRSACRYWIAPALRDYTVGCRVVLGPGLIRTALERDLPRVKCGKMPEF